MSQESVRAGEKLLVRKLLVFTAESVNFYLESGFELERFIAIIYILFNHLFSCIPLFIIVLH